MIGLGVAVINYKLTPRSGGFTLIELLVAMVLAALVITPLMGFMINIMDTDRKEQAKATSDQELQVSLDYIAQDLQQAVYIYDGEGVAAIQEQLPHYNDATKIPVLVFWKRQVIKDAIRYDGQSCSNDVTENCDDSFVYSLVAYYLIKNNRDNDAIWSGAAQIGRFQIKDGVQDPNYPVDKYGNPQYIKDHEPDQGFKLFNLDAQANTLKGKMNQWQKDQADYQESTKVLVDFIDQSTSGVPSAVDCSSVLGLDSSVNDDTLRVPQVVLIHLIPTVSMLVLIHPELWHKSISEGMPSLASLIIKLPQMLHTVVAAQFISQLQASELKDAGF